MAKSEPIIVAGPTAGYQALVDAGEIVADAAQQRAAGQLERLDDALEGYRPAHTRGVLARFGKSEAPTGIYLCGDVGRGKSMLMDLFFETAPLEKKRRVHFHAFMQEIHGAIKSWRDLSDVARRTELRKLGLKSLRDDPIPPVARQIAQDAHLLCFDEFQVNDVADAMILGRLFEALFEFGVVVVSTSNRPPNDLYTDGLNRQLFLPFIALLQDRLEVVHLDAAVDYRLDRIKGMQVYFAPLGPDSDASMDEDWLTLTGSASAVPCVLDVQGRKLEISTSTGGTMRESFGNLCKSALGPADYLAIAARFHTVFLDHIPQMAKAQRNEAKRFVTLIDALYEHRVKLVASAEVAPDQLYPDGDGAFEFARTASRLIEMQAQDYLSQSHKT